MKVLLCILIIVSRIHAVEAKGFTQPADADKFFALDGLNLSVFSNQALVPKVIGDLNAYRDGNSAILKTSISLLSPWGIKKGSLVQSIYVDNPMNDNDSLLSKFQFEDEAWLLLKPKCDTCDAEKDEPRYNYFTVFLGDESYVKKVYADRNLYSRLFPYQNVIKGFAYLGKDRQLQASKKNSSILSLFL